MNAYSSFLLLFSVLSFPAVSVYAASPPEETLTLSRDVYHDRLEGFWLGQSIANWTGLVTEMDKIGGEGPHGDFYTREDWGTKDEPSIWGQGVPSDLSETIDWVFDKNGMWGADDDTDIEYIYQHLLVKHKTNYLTAQQIQQGWLQHIYSDENTPFTNAKGEKENFLWVSNQTAHDLMRQGVLPPDTSKPENNPHFDMIDAQLTTEIFGLFAPGRPDIALDMARLPILTTAREDARWAAEFYVIMYSLAATLEDAPDTEQVIALAQKARKRLPEASYAAHMYDFVLSQFRKDVPWEAARDAVYQRYQVEQKDGYTVTSRELYCNGCFASGINFAASLISLFYGEGDYHKTIKIAVLCGWDADNPAATWGGMLGFIMGKKGLEAQFDRTFPGTFNIHRTRKGFANNGIDQFSAMAARGLTIVDRVVADIPGARRDTQKNLWHIPLKNSDIPVARLPANYPFYNKKESKTQ